MTLYFLLAADAFTPSARQAGIVGILAAAILYAYWYSRRKATTGNWPKFKRTELDTGGDVAARKDLAKLVAQLNDLSKQVEQRIDLKCAALEQTIHNADQRIAALRTLLEAARSAGIQFETRIAEKSPTSPSLQSLASGPSDLRTRRIYELADAGRSARQIAHELDQRIGEVELILNLRETAQTAA